MREAMAVSLVASYPSFCQGLLHDTDRPWTWLFDRTRNAGKLARHFASVQKKQKDPRPRGGGSGKKRTKPKKVPEQPLPLYSSLEELELSDEAKFLRLKCPDDRSKLEIEDSMEKTFEERKNIIHDLRCTTDLALEACPHLKSFEGLMIERGFESRFGVEVRNNLLRDYHALVPKLTLLGRGDPVKYPEDTCFKFKDGALNSLHVLARFLPKLKRVYPHETAMDTVPISENLFDIVPIGTELMQYMQEKREKNKNNVQPYILAVGTPAKFDRCYLALGDGHVMQLPRTTLPLKAIDLLFKSHFVLNSHYNLGWKNVFRYLEVNIYKLKVNGRARLSCFKEQHLQLTNEN